MATRGRGRGRPRQDIPVAQDQGSATHTQIDITPTPMEILPNTFAEALDRAKGAETGIIRQRGSQYSQRPQQPQFRQQFREGNTGSNSGNIREQFKARGKQFKRHGNHWTFYGKGSRAKIPLISVLSMTRLLHKGAECFLVYAIDISRSVPKLADIPIVSEFSDVFPDEIPGFPPVREVEFNIELMSGFSQIARPITQLTQKNAPFIWSQACEASFVELKKRLTSAPVLTIPSGVGGFTVHTDASHQGLGCVLMQHGRVVAYASRQLKPHESRYPVHDLELAAVAEPELFVKIKEAQRLDQSIQKSAELVRSGHQSEFQVNNEGILFVNDRIVVPNISELRMQILRDAHCSKFSVHPGSKKMYNDLKKQFWWKRMKSDIAEFVSHCLNCQQVKAERKRPGGLLHSLKVPEWKWDHITMDFVTKLPRSSRVRFGKKSKLSPRFIGPYEILERVGDLAYRLALPPALSGVHDVFHVSMLRKYHPDTSHVLPPDEVELDQTLSYIERPIQILDRKDKQLRNKLIPLIKVQWNRHGVEEATWELEDKMRQKYPELFK
ncbi:uncharacterized protein [Primulina eburnea]|uniref:uncharacterized protein n=1 Tax=Primulina eburnea TaxID=1245227 RepID=UPI003C6C9944